MAGKCGLPCGLRSAPRGARLCKLSAGCFSAPTSARKKHLLAPPIEFNGRIRFELADRRKKSGSEAAGPGSRNGHGQKQAVA